jgi:hypothetical protein
MKVALFAPKAAPCDGALMQRGGRLTRLWNWIDLVLRRVSTHVGLHIVTHVAAFDRPRKARCQGH